MNDTRPDAAKGKPDKDFDIVVNGEPHTVEDARVTYEQVVRLGFAAEADDPNKTFTVTYRKAAGPSHDGKLVEGGSVEVKNGTVFNVTSTTKS
jgi:hypothetical protein